jgi:hypothetical protein
MMDISLEETVYPKMYGGCSEVHKLLLNGETEESTYSSMDTYLRIVSIFSTNALYNFKHSSPFSTLLKYPVE